VPSPFLITVRGVARDEKTGRVEHRRAWLPPGRMHPALVTCHFLGALGLRLEGITEPSVESRQLHNALHCASVLLRRWRRSPGLASAAFSTS